MPPLQLSVIKRQLNDGLGHTMAEAIESEGVAQALMFSSRDTAEAMIAFIEKREPRFTRRVTRPGADPEVSGGAGQVADSGERSFVRVARRLVAVGFAYPSQPRPVPFPGRIARRARQHDRPSRERLGLDRRVVVRALRELHAVSFVIWPAGS